MKKCLCRTCSDGWFVWTACYMNLNQLSVNLTSTAANENNSYLLVEWTFRMSFPLVDAVRNQQHCSVCFLIYHFKNTNCTVESQNLCLHRLCLFVYKKILLNLFSDTNILISVFSSYLLFFTQNCVVG